VILIVCVKTAKIAGRNIPAHPALLVGHFLEARVGIGLYGSTETKGFVDSKGNLSRLEQPETAEQRDRVTYR
jgi:hypothetical protein